MKYTQYSELSSLLEKNGKSLNDWKENPDIDLIKEDDEKKDDKLDLEKIGFLKWFFTESGEAKKMLNKQAKKIYSQLKDKLVDKGLNDVFDYKKKVIQKLAELLREKQPKEVIKIMKKELSQLEKMQSKAIENLISTAESSLDTYKETLKQKIIKKYNLKGNKLAGVLVYWDILVAQIQNKLISLISNKSEGLIDAVIQDPKIKRIATEINKKVGGSKVQALVNQKNDEIVNLKKKVKSLQIDKKAVSSGDSGDAENGEPK
jgi:hypothetical protein